MNEYEIKAVFLNEDGFELGSQIFTIYANNVEEAYDTLEEEILNSVVLYPSDDYETELIDVH